MTLMDRRAFIARGIAATGGGALSAVALERLASRAALADKGHHGPSSYGEPQPMPDQLGREVLAVPAAFSYVTFGEIGSKMSDGPRTTGVNLDGMSAFEGPFGGTPRLIRNHEDRNAPVRGERARAAADVVRPRGGRRDQHAGLRHVEARPSSATSSPCTGTDRQLRRRVIVEEPRVAHRRGVGRRTGEHPRDLGPWPRAPWLRVRDPAAPRARTQLNRISR